MIKPLRNGTYSSHRAGNIALPRFSYNPGFALLRGQRFCRRHSVLYRRIGQCGDYIDSLTRLRYFGPQALYPGHGKYRQHLLKTSIMRSPWAKHSCFQDRWRCRDFLPEVGLLLIGRRSARSRVGIRDYAILFEVLSALDSEIDPWLMCRQMPTK